LAQGIILQLAITTFLYQWLAVSEDVGSTSILATWMGKLAKADT